MTKTMEEKQSDFWENIGDVFGTDIIGSASHPLKEAFKLYCEMMDEYEDDEEEEEEEEEEEDEEDDEEEEEDDWKYLCPNQHWGGQYGCDLCFDEFVPDIKNTNMEKEWLNNCDKYCYKLHKKWFLNKKTDTEDSSTDEEEEEEHEHKKEEEV
jgi:hypothetical protein